MSSGSRSLVQHAEAAPICQALGIDPRSVCTWPMVLGSSKGEKLSKRHGATSV